MQAGSDGLRWYVLLQLRRDVHMKGPHWLIALEEGQVEVIIAKRFAELVLKPVVCVFYGQFLT